MKNAYDRLDLLESFVCIAESRSLSQAARRLGITQPTASRRLAELEALLGCQLATRSTAAFALTDEGRLLLQEARELGERWSGLADRVMGRSTRPEGTLRVAGTAGYSSSFLTDAATDLMAAHPGLRVELSVADGPVDLAGSGAECWVFVGRVPEIDIVCLTLGRMQRLLIATPDLLARLGAVSLQRLPRLPFVSLVPHVGSELRLQHADGRRRQLTLDSPFRTSSLASSYRAVLNGAGIGSAALWMCAPELAAGRLVRVLPEWSLEPIGVHVALPPGRYRPARVTAFIDALRARLAAQPGFTPAD